jgi:hypothetical protein
MNNDARNEEIMLQAEADSKPQGSKRPNRAAQLIELAFDEGVELYLDQYSEPHVTVPEQPMAGFPVGSRSFRRWLAGKAYAEQNKGFSGEIFSQVVNTLEGQAIHEKSVKNLYTRIARVGGTIYYDLADDRQVVEITPGNWRVTDQCPIRFRRFPHQKQQATPLEGGELTKLLEYFNLSREYEKLLLLTYAATLLVPTIPRVALIITGEQGAAKSTGLSVLRALIDPSEAALLSPMRDASSLFETASQHYCMYLDNLSSLSDEVSDALCRLVTGGSFSKRKLYTDDEQIVISLKVAVGLTGINLVANRADLLDRSLILTFERIPDDKRLDEEEFWAKFEQERPLLLGTLFSTLAKALETYPTLQMPQKPRMADYARYAAACAMALGYSAEEFYAAYSENTRRQNQAALESSPTAQVIVKFMEDKDHWHGSSSELHKALTPIAEQQNLAIGGTGGFPRSAHYLWQRIIVVRPNLNAAGIQVTHSEQSISSTITLRRTGPAVPVATMATLLQPRDGPRDKERVKELFGKLQQGQQWIESHKGDTAKIHQLEQRAEALITELESLGISRTVSGSLLTFPVSDLDSFIDSLFAKQQSLPT